MSVTKKSAKVSPIRIIKRDNFLQNSEDTVRRLKLTIYIQAVLGINRLYLYHSRKLLVWISHLCSLAYVMTVLYYFIAIHADEGATLVYKITCCVEYLLLILTSKWSQGQKLEILFRNLTTFDDMLNINKDLASLFSSWRPIIWIIVSLIYAIGEIALLITYAYDYFDYVELIIYLTVLAHDSEQVFFCSLLRLILWRLRIVKAHVAKAFLIAEKEAEEEELNKFETLSKNAELNTSDMHRAYELLHTCADELNSIMSFPMIVMLFASGLSTTLLLKNIFKLATEADPTMYARVMIIYASVRCIKYTILVVIPCLFSSITNKQVSLIRTMLHDTLHTIDLEKTERRRIKAFFQLTQDNEFAYALWGVIRLNMSLPLSYSSLCTTYLVIIIQFSKFID